MSEEDYETIESQLLMVIAEFESKWSKAWDAWLKTTGIPEDEAVEMVNSPYDGKGNLMSKVREWDAIYGKMKAQIEEKHNAKIMVSCEGEVSATHHLPDGDTITVP